MWKNLVRWVILHQLVNKWASASLANTKIMEQAWILEISPRVRTGFRAEMVQSKESLQINKSIHGYSDGSSLCLWWNISIQMQVVSSRMIEWFEDENGVNHMLWVLRSWDMHAVENLLKILNWIFKQCWPPPPPSSWERISFGRMVFFTLAQIQRLVKSMPRCFEALYCISLTEFLYDRLCWSLLLILTSLLFGKVGKTEGFSSCLVRNLYTNLHLGVQYSLLWQQK